MFQPIDLHRGIGLFECDIVCLEVILLGGWMLVLPGEIGIGSVYVGVDIIEGHVEGGIVWQAFLFEL